MHPPFDVPDFPLHIGPYGGPPATGTSALAAEPPTTLHQAFERGLQVGRVRQSYWDMCVGALWGAGLTLAVLALCISAGWFVGMQQALTAGAASAPLATAAAGLPGALAAASLAALPAALPPALHHHVAAHGSAWHRADYGACRLCQHGDGAAAARCCTAREVTGGAMPVPVAEARRHHGGACGPEALYLDFPGLRA